MSCVLEKVTVPVGELILFSVEEKKKKALDRSSVLNVNLSATLLIKATQACHSILLLSAKILVLKGFLLLCQISDYSKIQKNENDSNVL